MTTQREKWLEKVKHDLKGESLRNSFGKLNISSIYFSDEVNDELNEPITTEEDTNVFISQIYSFCSYQLLQEQMQQDLLHGVNLLVFEWDANFDKQKFKKTLEPIYLHMIDFMFVGFPDISEVLLCMEELCVSKEISPAELKLWFSLDICGSKEDFNRRIVSQFEVYEKYSEIFPKAQFFGLNPSQLTQKGISSTDEVLCLAQALNQFFSFSEQSLTLSRELFYLSSLHCDFYEDIAKLRALQNIVLNIKGAHGINPKEVALPIFSYFNERFISSTDVLTNCLRIASAGFSAYVSNCRAFISTCFDFRTKNNSELGYRLQRNLQHILLEESHLDRVKDPAAGSYYFEHYTKEMSDHIWQKFLQNPGLNSELTQVMLEESLQYDTHKHQKGDLKRVGVNIFTNPLETRIKERIYSDFVELKKHTRYVDEVFRG